MRIALDAQLTVGTATGIGEYVRGLIDALRQRGLDAIALREPRLDPWRFDRRVLWDQAVLPRRARSSGAQLLHCAAGTMPRMTGMPIVVTVHDLAWHEAQAHAPAYARYYFGPFSLHRYRGAARIVVDSNFSRDRLLRILGDFDPSRVEVVYPGVAADFCGVVARRRRRRDDPCGRNGRAAQEPRGADSRASAIARGSTGRDRSAHAVRARMRAARAAVAGRRPHRDAWLRAARAAYRALRSVAPLQPYPRATKVLGMRRRRRFVPACRASFPIVPRFPRLWPAMRPAWTPTIPVLGPPRSAPHCTAHEEPRARQVRAAAIARFSWETSAQRIESVYASSVDR